MIAVYARVSTGIQVAEGTSLDSQVNLCKEKALQMGYHESEIVIYKEEGASGEDIDRPAMNQLRDDIIKGIYSYIVCTHPDRLSRDLTDKLVVCKELERNGIELVFVDTEYQNTPEGQLFFNMQSAIAQYELAQIRKRTVRGKLNTVKRDKKVMPMRASPFGYDFADGRLTVNKYEAEFVKLIYEWYVRDNLTMREIGEKLYTLGAMPKRGESPNWGSSSIRRILTSEVYIGTFYFNRRKSSKVKGEKTLSGKPKKTYEFRDPSEWVKLEVPAIIDKGLFDLAQKQKVRNLKSSKGNVKHDYLVKSLLKCGNCGLAWQATTYTGRTDKKTGLKKQYPVYRCHGINPRRYGAGIEKCTTRSIKGELLDEYVWKSIADVVLDPDALIADFSVENSAIDKTLKSKMDILTNQIKSKEKELERLKNLYVKGIINDVQLDDEYSQINRDKTSLENELQQFQSNVEYQNRREKGTEKLKEIVEGFKKSIQDEQEGKTVLSPEQKRHIVELLVDEIIIEFDGNDVTLTYIGFLDELKRAKAGRKNNIDSRSQPQEV